MKNGRVLTAEKKLRLNDDIIDDGVRIRAPACSAHRLFYCPENEACICFRSLSAMGVKL